MLKRIKEEILSLNSVLQLDSYNIIAETTGDKLTLVMLYVTDEIEGLKGKQKNNKERRKVRRKERKQVLNVCFLVLYFFTQLFISF